MKTLNIILALLFVSALVALADGPAGDYVGALNAAVTAQADTNTTTTATQYTPRRKGDILVGAITNNPGVWISKGTTTNDWVQVKP